jgi:tripartite-type tricarboxylate transporter receptor subunit TctC
MSNNVKKIMVMVLIIGFLICGTTMMASADFPDHTIRLIVAYSAGGSSDTLARTMAQYWEKELGVNIYVENLPGAGAEIGFTALARANPDGYTVGIINLPALNLLNAARETAYHPVDSYDAIGVHVQDPNVMAARIDDERFQDFNDVVEFAKEHPGELIVGADGPLSDDQLGLYKVLLEEDIVVTYIPYDGGAPAKQALLSGEIDIVVENAFDVIRHEEAVNSLVTLWDERYHMIPDVPTYKELRGVELVGSSTRGIAAPAGIPEDRLQILRETWEAAVNNPEHIEDCIKRGITLIDPVKVGEEFKEVMISTQEDVDSLLPFFREMGYIE